MSLTNTRLLCRPGCMHFFDGVVWVLSKSRLVFTFYLCGAGFGAGPPGSSLSQEATAAAAANAAAAAAAAVMQNAGTQPTAEGMEQVCYRAACGCVDSQIACVSRL